MTNSKRALPVLSGVVLLMTSVAQAGIIGTGTSFAGLTNDSANWQNYGTVGTFVLNGSSTVTTGNTVTFTSGFSDGNSGQIWINNALSGGTSFNGGFTNGDYLVSTLDNQAPSTPDTLTLTLTNAVSEFGLYIEEFDYQNNYTATISTHITSVTLSTGGPEAGYFVIGTAYFQDGTTTPEPASLMMVGVQSQSSPGRLASASGHSLCAL
jgi:hypothetical protein